MTQLGMTHALKGVTSERRQFHMEAEGFLKNSMMQYATHPH